MAPPLPPMPPLPEDATPEQRMRLYQMYRRQLETHRQYCQNQLNFAWILIPIVIAFILIAILSRM